MREQAARRRLLRDAARAGLALGNARLKLGHTLLFGGLLGLNLRDAYAAGLVAVRFWPGPEYSRLAIEIDAPIRATERKRADPPELVVDIATLDSSSRLQALLAAALRPDPLLRTIWVQSRPGEGTRLRIALAPGTRPQVFTLLPARPYRHRLVIDLYPAQRTDPLNALMREPSGGSTQSDPLAKLLERPGGSPTPQGRRNRPPSERGPGFVVAIDAGHGGEDPGAIGPAGTYEKDVVLAIARELRTLVNAEPGMRAYMTRSGDYFVPLASRVQRARRVRADIFVSIHADAYPEPRPRGASVYVLSERGASSTTARWLAQRENGSDEVGGVQIGHRDREVRRILLDLSTGAQVRESNQLATHLLAALGQVGPLHKPRVEGASFAVLRSPDMPSVLVETAFISNPAEERRLADPEHQRRIARAMLAGIRSYRESITATAPGLTANG
jgi:N-acetylmuramoyl-L-alanine amidase